MGLCLPIDRAWNSSEERYFAGTCVRDKSRVELHEQHLPLIMTLCRETDFVQWLASSFVREAGCDRLWRLWSSPSSTRS